MRILLDECVPRPFKFQLSEYELKTVVEMGWSGKKNGELLALMTQERFTVFLTTDRNLRHQQNLEKVGIAMIVLLARSNRLADLVPLVPQVKAVLPTIGPGDVVEIQGL